MAPNETKFYLSRIIVSAAVFISLCVPSTAEVRRCYWCGPLAEQVHRSQRAPPCSGAHTQLTVCDPGFPYCAVVATSPPYIESRYCIKLYQDECYSLYCNSTRTWRMTCPCQGDLCNGPNTEREEDAFAGLAKLVARSQNTRIRRALISTSGFISMNTNSKNRIDNTTVEENKNIPNDTLNNDENEEVDVKNNDSQTNDTGTTADVENTKTDAQMDDTIASTVADVKSDENQMNETSPTTKVDIKNNEIQTSSPTVIADEIDKNNGNQVHVKNNDSQTNDTGTTVDVENTKTDAEMDDTIASTIADVKSDEKQMNETSPTAKVDTKNNEMQTSSPTVIADEIDKNNGNQVHETSIQIDIPAANFESSDLKTEIILMISESTKLVNDTKASDITTIINENTPNIETTTPELVKQMSINLKATAETTTEATITSPTEVKINVNKVKPSEQLLTAEALQHNVTPTIKTTEQTTMSTTTAIKIQHMQATTEASKPLNNTAVRIDTNILTLVVGIILQF